MSRIEASRLFIIMSGGNALLRSAMYLVMSIYYVLAVHMTPLQLILAGTALELSYFLCQMPTGMFADVVSRRLSIILGWAIAGACFAAEGLAPNVAVILAAQAVLGLGEAFIDGAESAWLADEVGMERLGEVSVRGSQIGQIASIAGILVAAALGSVRLNLPVLAGGIGLLGMSVYFMFAMPEDGHRSARREGEALWSAMSGSLRSGIRAVRGSEILVTILGVELFWGAGSEGFDRLWTAHIIRDVHLPLAGTLKPVTWFALLAIAGAAIGYGVNRLLAPHVNRLAADAHTMARVLAALNLLYLAVTAVFALTGSFVLAVIFLLIRGAILTPGYVLRDLWFNRSITDSSVRATVLSMGGQANALGQWVGGPLIGALGNAVSLRAAITAAALVPAPISLLYGRTATRRLNREREILASTVATESL